MWPPNRSAPNPNTFCHPRVLYRLSDQGGGIAEEDMAAVWQFGFTTTRAGRRHSGHSGGSGSLSSSSLGRASSEEAGGPVAEGLGLDNAPPGVSFGATWAAMESSVGGMGRFRIAGACALETLWWAGRVGQIVAGCRGGDAVCVGGGGGLGWRSGALQDRGCGWWCAGRPCVCASKSLWWRWRGDGGGATPYACSLTHPSLPTPLTFGCCCSPST